jgi:hypothetical protein
MAPIGLYFSVEFIPGAPQRPSDLDHRKQNRSQIPIHDLLDYLVSLFKQLTEHVIMMSQQIRKKLINLIHFDTGTFIVIFISPVSYAPDEGLMAKSIHDIPCHLIYDYAPAEFETN